ncbi:hypothetical protein P154DRAFT_581586 [Amniculicola lignicola CBS 123094]|uniref:F-box domain-containing protein n=1 Tax=Amniculicola lignicola CBS 123094 TaxID=1392246 RepID=A0A6A5W674_9PLEO|nr:hypothetical protein P154DRAFT_581586 [Amniculicola lignicola CBS 123094]
MDLGILCKSIDVEKLQALSPGDLALFKEMTGLFFDNSDFRAHIRRNLDPPFNFMGLPPEIRLVIAEYALALDDEFEWHWEGYTPRKLINRILFNGTVCNRIRNPLSLVSRQLNVEFKNLHFRANQVCFGPRWNLGTPGFLHGIPLFLATSPDDVLKSVRAIALKEWDCQNLQFKAFPFPRFTTSHHDRRRITAYMRFGYMVQDFVRDWFANENRQWRIFPSPDCKFGGLNMLKENLSEQDFEVGSKWLAYGI